MTIPSQDALTATEQTQAVEREAAVPGGEDTFAAGARAMQEAAEVAALACERVPTNVRNRGYNDGCRDVAEAIANLPLPAHRPPQPGVVTEELRKLAEQATQGRMTFTIVPERYPECDDADLPGYLGINGTYVALVFEKYGDCLNYEANGALLAGCWNFVRDLLAAPSPGSSVTASPADVDSEMASVAWAVERWNAEVANRPLRNIHRRSLDDTWRQVIRHFDGDDEVLCGPRHDDLVAANPSLAVTASPADGDVIEALREVAKYANEPLMIAGRLGNDNLVGISIRASVLGKAAAALSRLEASQPASSGSEASVTLETFLRGRIETLTHENQRLRERLRATPSPAAETAAGLVDALREAIECAEGFILTVPHGENCYLSDHYEGDPGNRCNCGKDSVVQVLDAALSRAGERS